MAPIYAADRVYIETLLYYVKITYGSFSEYAQEKLQLNDEFVERLKDQLLETTGS